MDLTRFLVTWLDRNGCIICVRKRGPHAGQCAEIYDHEKVLVMGEPMSRCGPDANKLFSPDVEFCGYTIPHPSEPYMNLRIQTYGKHGKIDPLADADKLHVQRMRTCSRCCGKAWMILRSSATSWRTSSLKRGTISMLQTRIGRIRMARNRDQTACI